MKDEFLIKGALKVLEEMEEYGDPYIEDNWSLTEVLVDYVKLKNKDLVVPPNENVEHWCTECQDFHS